MVEGLAPPTRAVVHSHDTICRRLRIQYVFLHMCGVNQFWIIVFFTAVKPANNILFWSAEGEGREETRSSVTDWSNQLWLTLCLRTSHEWGFFNSKTWNVELYAFAKKRLLALSAFAIKQTFNI